MSPCVSLKVALSEGVPITATTKVSFATGVSAGSVMLLTPDWLELFTSPQKVYEDPPAELDEKLPLQQHSAVSVSNADRRNLIIDQTPNRRRSRKPHCSAAQKDDDEGIDSRCKKGDQVMPETATARVLVLINPGLRVPVTASRQSRTAATHAAKAPRLATVGSLNLSQHFPAALVGRQLASQCCGKRAKTARILTLRINSTEHLRFINGVILTTSIGAENR